MNKKICFTDIHYGNKRNDILHNQDCNQFIDFVIEKAKEHDIKECVFLGDWHHSRHTINVETLQYSFNGMYKLNDYFEKVYFIVGNHDMYYRDSRDVTSLIMASGLDKFIVVDEPLKDGDFLFVPWLVGEEWQQIKKQQAKYIFGHFELPNFYLNSMIAMPDKGELNANDFDKESFVFSGHFHKRQNLGNVWYIGNAFPHTFDDTDDDERGCMILHDKGFDFYAWGDAPKYRKYNYEELVNNEEYLLEGVTKIYAKLFYNSSEVTPIQINNYREQLKEKFDFRVLEVIDTATTTVVEISEETQDDEDNVLENIDDTVVKQIRKQESDEYDIELLVELYKDLE